MKGFLFFSFFLYFVDSVFAGEMPSPEQRDRPPADVVLKKLLTISSDVNSNQMNLMLMVDAQGNAQGMYKQEVPGYVPEEGETGASVYFTRDIESPAGAVLLNRKERDVLILQGQLDRSTQEGRFKIKYLTNGLTMSYEACEIHLKKNPDGWYVENAYTGEKVTKAKVTTNWMGIGISTIQGICAN